MNDKLKILHYLVSLDFGGLQKLVVELSIKQLDDDTDINIMCNNMKGDYYAELKNNKIRLIESNVKSGFNFNLIRLLKLRKIFCQFDIIHLHCFSPLITYAAILSSAKTVFTIHGLSKGMRKNTFKNYLREKIKTSLLNRINCVVANSDYTLNRSKSHYGLLNTNTLTIYNGIKMNNLKIKTKIKSDVFTIGLVSRFNLSKRIDIAVRCFEKFKNITGEGELILIGDGETFEDIKRLVKISKYKSSIKLMGYKSNVEKYYPLFDIFLFPARGEGFGLTAIESYLNGISVLALSDAGGLKEIVENIEPMNIKENEDQIVDGMLYYYKNKEILIKKSSILKDYVNENFSIKKMSENYRLAYNQLLIDS